MRQTADHPYNAAPVAMMIDGAALARQIRELVKARTAELAAKGRAVHLTAILVGSTGAGELYAQRQKETCAAVGINYELMLRLTHPPLVAEARSIFSAAQAQGRRIEFAEWKRARSFWVRLRERWAYFVLARVDPHVAQRQWRALPD